MRASNFRLRSSIYLVVDGYELDMHNDYDVASVQHEIAKQQVTFTFFRLDEKGVDKNAPASVRLIYEGVTQFTSIPGDISLPASESQRLSGFGYQADESWCDGQFWVDVEPDESWSWSIELQSGQEFLILGASARAEVDL